MFVNYLHKIKYLDNINYLDKIKNILNQWNLYLVALFSVIYGNDYIEFHLV